MVPSMKYFFCYEFNSQNNSEKQKPLLTYSTRDGKRPELFWTGGLIVCCWTFVFKCGNRETGRCQPNQLLQRRKRLGFRRRALFISVEFEWAPALAEKKTVSGMQHVFAASWNQSSIHNVRGRSWIRIIEISETMKLWQRNHRRKLAGGRALEAEWCFTIAGQID